MEKPAQRQNLQIDLGVGGAQGFDGLRTPREGGGEQIRQRRGRYVERFREKQHERIPAVKCQFSRQLRYVSG